MDDVRTDTCSHHPLVLERFLVLIPGVVDGCLVADLGDGDVPPAFVVRHPRLGIDLDAERRRLGSPCLPGSQHFRHFIVPIHSIMMICRKDR